MKRRGFFGALLGSAAALAVDPERLIWQPGRKLISIPKPPPVALAVPKNVAQLIQAAMQSLGALSAGQIPSQQDAQAALYRMNAMLASWNCSRLRPEYVDAAIYGLAARLAPMYGRPEEAETLFRRSEALLRYQGVASSAKIL